MEDSKIIDLYWARSDDAIRETSAKYGGYCRTIAFSILSDHGSSEECVNDTWLAAWNTIPPSRPGILSAYLGRITRRIAVSRWRSMTAKKRGGLGADTVFEELEESICDGTDPDRTVDKIVLDQVLDRFLSSLPAEQRIIFVQRYWYFLSIKEIACAVDISESKVKMSLLRSRNRLKELLEKEGLL